MINLKLTNLKKQPFGDGSQFIIIILYQQNTNYYNDLNDIIFVYKNNYNLTT